MFELHGQWVECYGNATWSWGYNKETRMNWVIRRWKRSPERWSWVLLLGMLALFLFFYISTSGAWSIFRNLFCSILFRLHRRLGPKTIFLCHKLHTYYINKLSIKTKSLWPVRYIWNTMTSKCFPAIVKIVISNF